MINKKSTGYYSIVDESIYDNHGREAISVIPAPDDASQLKYHKDFNLNEDGDPYSAIDFDSSGKTNEICNTSARPMSTASGASRYYSDQTQIRRMKMHIFQMLLNILLHKQNSCKMGQEE